MCYIEKYINPFTDYGFKKIFGDTENTELLRSLINDILGLEGKDQIETIIFKNGELLPDSPEDRKAIFDLYCTDEKRSEFIVELKKEKEELNSHLEWWLYVFQNLNKLQDIPQKLKGDVIEKAFEKAEFLKLPKAEQDKYHKNLKVYRDLINSIDTARKEGVEEGIEQEKKESKKKIIEIAKSLLDVLDSETIALKTGLSIEEIEELRDV